MRMAQHGKCLVWQHKGATMEDIELQELEFYIGQKFYGVYPPEAAIWCNANNAMIVEKTEQQESEDGTVDVKYYEICEVPEPTEEEIKQARIVALKAELDSTDYKIIKCSECSLAGVELPYDIAELHAQRQAIRDEINELEGE